MRRLVLDPTGKGEIQVHQLYNKMAPIGQMHAHMVTGPMDAMIQQATTHAAMAGALVARGMTPSEAFHTVMAMEGAGMTIPISMHVPPSALMLQRPAQAAAPGHMMAKPTVGQPLWHAPTLDRTI